MAQQIFPGVYFVEGKIATANLTPGFKVYGEKVVQESNVEYRIWDLHRSKLAAAIRNGLKNMPIGPGSTVLYLGASTGTTASHISDIVGKDGLVYCIEFAQRPMRELLRVCEKKENMLPIMADARRPKDYALQIEKKVDVIYQDVAQPDQDKILVENSKLLLKEGGWAMVAVKSQSIDVTKKPSEVFEEFKRNISSQIYIKEEVKLEPYDFEHLFLVGRKK
ncbi:MAG: fibrillarin-like rRNA/tRNA 2'-O-methyltransferase [Candidatus Anstonellaceae archaeon]